MADDKSDFSDPAEVWGLAVSAFESGNFDRAVDLAEQLCTQIPTEPAFRLLLGNSEIKRNKPENAIPHLSKAAELDPQNPTAWLFLGEAFEIAGNWNTAADAFLAAGRLTPSTSVPHARLFQVVSDQLKRLQLGENKSEDRAVAIRFFDRWLQDFVGEIDLEKALQKLGQHFGQSENWTDRMLFAHLSRILMFMDNGEKAVDVFSKSTLPVEQASAGENKAHEVLRKEYGEMARAYDANLVSQSVSRTLVDFVVGIIGSRRGNRILDAACGTGLVGLNLHEFAEEMVGIDLSPDMLSEAEKKGIYAKLTIGDVAVALKEHDGSFDIITSANALYHLPDLSGFFAGAAARLSPGGILAFSVDPCADEWEVRASLLGGFTHSRRYLRRMAAENGLKEIDIQILEHRIHLGFYAAFQFQ